MLRPLLGCLHLSLSARRAWIEINACGCRSRCLSGSLSARRAWIEIGCAALPSVGRDDVALRKESVDRNDLVGQMEHKRGPVALRKESVDRNTLHGRIGA